MGPGDGFHRLVDEGYRLFERPAPRHVPGCSCALCADAGMARALFGRGARAWGHEDIVQWCARATRVAGDGRGGAEVVSRTDRAVFRFLLPRVLEAVASGAVSHDGAIPRALALFAPGRAAGCSPAERALLTRFAGLLLDRAMQDPDWPENVLETLHLLASGGWPLQPLLRHALSDPDLPAALARIWGRPGRRDTLFPGNWQAGAAAALCEAFVTSMMVERMMNYAMADDTPPDEVDAAMRTADLLIRSA
ncbi:hypothetical protein P6F26_12800 [Roseibacterium sp. SDUM158017]|nr:hypothetical protein [Roseibacterium sp. SDUM158017]